MNSSGGVTNRPSHTVAATPKRAKAPEHSEQARALLRKPAPDHAHPSSSSGPKATVPIGDVQDGEDHQHVQPAAGAAGSAGKGLVPGLGGGEEDRGDDREEQQGEKRLASPQAGGHDPVQGPDGGKSQGAGTAGSDEHEALRTSAPRKAAPRRG